MIIPPKISDTSRIHPNTSQYIQYWQYIVRDLLMTVYGGTWRYMAVHAKFYQSMAVHNDICQYIFRSITVYHDGSTCQWRYIIWICAGEVPPADFGALLKALNCMHNQWQLLQVIACTNSFIHPLTSLPVTPLPQFDLPAACAACQCLGSGSRWWDQLCRLPRSDPGPTGGRRNLGRRGGCGSRREGI
jgi:hypothetical protein